MKSCGHWYLARYQIKTLYILYQKKYLVGLVMMLSVLSLCITGLSCCDQLEIEIFYFFFF